MVKRQMYGCPKLDLLQAGLIGAPVWTPTAGSGHKSSNSNRADSALCRRPRHLRSSDSNAAPTIAEPIDVALDEWPAPRRACGFDANAERPSDLAVTLQQFKHCKR
jgi:hypothetical protein